MRKWMLAIHGRPRLLVNAVPFTIRGWPESCLDCSHLQTVELRPG